jgi:DNA-binding NarL/FixJ family response regulator
MKKQSNRGSKKTRIKKPDSIVNENSKTNPAFFISSESPLSKSEIKQDNSERKSVAFNLTDKELAIIISLSKGNSYKMIANDCNITINTVRQHIRNIHQKLKVHSSLEAVLLALKESLLFASFVFQV